MIFWQAPRLLERLEDGFGGVELPLFRIDGCHWKQDLIRKVPYRLEYILVAGFGKWLWV